MMPLARVFFAGVILLTIGCGLVAEAARHERHKLDAAEHTQRFAPPPPHKPQARHPAMAR